MKKLLILSGKGGTGKTTTAAAFIDFSKARAIADCDVDAPNLHLVTKMDVSPVKSNFTGAQKSYIDPDKCVGCETCKDNCRFNAIKVTEDGLCAVQEYACEGCGVCEYVCPVGAVTMKDDVAGEKELYKGEKVFSTATLKMGRGNSGKLVTEVKNDMTSNAYEDTSLAIIDGSPGIGCPVIASVSGVDLVLIVAEPSLSGKSDLERIIKTTQILQTKAAVCVNKYDTNVDKTNEIISLCEELGIPYVGKVPYDKKASKAINSGISLASYDCPARDALYEIYIKTLEVLTY